MNNSLSSTIGAVYPNIYDSGNWTPGFAALKDNPGFPSTPLYTGSITIGEHTYEVTQQYHAGSHELTIKRDGTQISSPYVGFSFDLVGFAAYVDNDIVHVFYVSTPDEETINNVGQIWEHVSGSYTYHAVEIASAVWSDVATDNWEQTPSDDPDDPFNTLPSGGEFAERDIFGDTFLQDIDAMPDPENYELDYSKLIFPYMLTSGQLQSIGSGLFFAGFWTNLKNKFEGLSDPLSFILDCVELPIGGEYPGGIARFRLGGELVEDAEGHSIGCGVWTHRYHKFSFGSVNLKEMWGSAKDYSDTSISIFLPYVGVKEVDPDIVLNTTTTLIMYVDVWNGDVLYLLQASNATSHYKYYRNDNVVYRWAGNCGKKIPLGRVDQTTPILNMAANLASIGAGFAVGGVPGAAMSGLLGAQNNVLHNGFNPTVQTSGGISGSTGRMDFHYAYYIIKRGVPEYPDGWRAEFGAPRYQTFSGTDLHGYTQFAEIHIDLPQGASDSERAELVNLLKTEGVIL